MLWFPNLMLKDFKTYKETFPCYSRWMVLWSRYPGEHTQRFFPGSYLVLFEGVLEKNYTLKSSYWSIKIMLQASGSGKVSPCWQTYYTVQPPAELRYQQSNPWGPGKSGTCHIANKKNLRNTIILKKKKNFMYFILQFIKLLLIVLYLYQRQCP